MRKTAIGFVISVRPSLRYSGRMQQRGFQWTDFCEIWYLRALQKSVGKMEVSLKSDKDNVYFI